MGKSRKNLASLAVLATVVALAAIAVVPAMASASKVSVNGGKQLKFSGQGKEANVVGVSLVTGTYTVSDLGSGVTLKAGKGCVQTSPSTADCLDTGVTSLQIVVGSGNDTAALSPMVLAPAGLIGGGGNDTLTGGSGNDNIVAGGGDDTVDGALGADKINCGGGLDTVVPDLADTVSGNC